MAEGKSSSAQATYLINSLMLFLAISASWLGAYLGILRERWKQERESSVQLEEWEEIKTKHEQLMSASLKASIEIAHLKADTQAIDEKIPRAENLNPFLDALNSHALAAGLSLRKIEKQQSYSAGAVIATPFALSLQGNFAQTQLFLSQIFSLPRLVTLKKVYMDLQNQSISEGGSQLSIDLELLIFSMNPAYLEAE